MNDLEQELRDLLETRVGDARVDPAPPPGVLKRARRRQVGTVVTAVVATTAVLLGSIIGVQTLLEAEPSPPPRPADVPVLPDAPGGFSPAVLPYASISYPDGWFLLETSPLLAGAADEEALPTGPVLQLSNFDPDVLHAPRCTVEPDNIPPTGVLLTVSVVSPRDTELLPSDGAWPVELHQPAPNTEPVCERGRSEEASWTAPSGVQYWASAIYGPDADEAEIATMKRAYSTLVFPPSSAPQLPRMSAVQGLGTPRIVLGTTTFGGDVLTFVAYLELGRALWVGVQSNGPWTGATAPYSGSEPAPDVSAGLAAVMPAGALLYGTISPDVARVEARTDSGDVAPVSVVPLPGSLGIDDRFVWATIAGGGDRSTIVGYDTNGEPIGNPSFPVGPSTVLASGEVDGVPWTLTLEDQNQGWMVSFELEGQGGGGGGFADLGDRVFYGASSGGPSWSADTGLSTFPLELYGQVTDRADRVEYQMVNGDSIDASLYDVPERGYEGQIYLLFVPGDVLVHAGEVVAYDADGVELGRQYLDFSPTALFAKGLEDSSPEAVEAMRDLQLAGAVAGRYYGTHDLSWEGFGPEAAAAISDDVVYNAAPTAVVGEVSIRVAGPEGLVLATVATNGEVYAACMEFGSTSYYGRNDATDPGECTNGWLDPPG
ncbi:MAG: hypothetical protein ACRDHU_06805 [Actinomycetota bacterium]